MVKRSCSAIAALILALSVSGCALLKQSEEPLWQTTVLPTDDTPHECKDKPAKRPVPAARAHDGDEAAREYKRLSIHDDAVVKQLERCALWARGQRQ